MSDLPKRVSIHEVGPREGFQFEKGLISTDEKVRFVDALSETGVRRIEVTSFVHPKWVPQMADAEEVTARFTRKPGVSYNAVYLNEKGLERTLAAGKFDVEGILYLTASDTFSRKNTNKGIQETIEALPNWIQVYRSRGIEVTTGGIMAAFGCNYEGDVPLDRVLSFVEAFLRLGQEHGFTLRTLQLADTMGWANPVQMKRTIGAVRDRWPDLWINLHLHDTRGTGISNAVAAMELGVADFDSSCAGLGGCPFAGHKDAAGNIVTEDFAMLCEEMGIETGIDVEHMAECARMAEDIVGHSLPGKVAKAATLASYRRALRVASVA